MTLNTTTTLVRGATTLTLPIPMPGYTPAHTRAQAIGETADGTLYVYDKTVTHRVLTISWELSTAQKDAWLTFFDSTIVGCSNTFTYTDHLGVAHANCRLRDPEPRLEKLPSNRFRLTLEIHTTTDPD